MAKKKEEISLDEQKTEREMRWAEHVARYAIANPVKYAQKNERGEFKEVPATFK